MQIFLRLVQWAMLTLLFQIVLVFPYTQGAPYACGGIDRVGQCTLLEFLLNQIIAWNLFLMLPTIVTGTIVYLFLRKFWREGFALR